MITPNHKTLNKEVVRIFSKDFPSNPLEPFRGMPEKLTATQTELKDTRAQLEATSKELVTTRDELTVTKTDFANAITVFTAKETALIVEIVSLKSRVDELEKPSLEPRLI